MVVILSRCTLLLLLLLHSGCSALLMNQMDSNTIEKPVGVDRSTLATIQQLIELQPGLNKVQITFNADSALLQRDHIVAINNWLVKPIKKVEIRVGPVRHENLISAINISRERGRRVTKLLNTFQISTRVSYDPDLAINTVEVSGWL